ncbi:rab-like GTPase activating protein [Trypanosoma conorhini]|uniref:Rab-like GTPase activating protein n=1 Tax=Trypanosoma conorhini TaxID=83891 RepID=A0A3R7L9Q4_9TRYP|nr:rab-like GTPase activating protein [Trypanosoma conorhini]RNF23972.1 rab-like GTPase activating protein [Trypanosoma conorhini]
MTERFSKPNASPSPRLASSSANGRGASLAGNGVTDRYGFFVDAERKAEEDEYIWRHPEMPAKQRMWAGMLGQWGSVSQQRRKMLCREGIPQSMRRIVWPVLLESGDRLGFEADAYQALKSRPAANPELFAVIERDLGRTFPTHRWFVREDGVGRSKLRGILRAYANLDPEVGYVQGMAFLASTLLLHIEDEEKTFCAFVSLMHRPKYSMSKMFSAGFPALHMRFYQLEKLMRRRCTSLLRLLKKFHVTPELYATQWFLTLFSYQLDFGLLSRIWDMFLCEGWKIIFRVSITFFCSTRKLCGMRRMKAIFF